MPYFAFLQARAFRKQELQEEAYRVKQMLLHLPKNPIYATGVGLLKYGQKQVASGAATQNLPATEQVGFMDKMKTWIKGNF